MQRTFYLNNERWKKLIEKAHAEGFKGKGQIERYMESIIDNNILILRGEGKVKITIENNE